MSGDALSVLRASSHLLWDDDADLSCVEESPFHRAEAPASVRVIDDTNTSEAADPDADERPFSLSIRDFITVERPKREPLLAELDGRTVVGARSLTLCGALGGQGKTTYFIDLGLHMAAGVDYPPFKVPRPVSILVIENEGPEELFAEKLDGRLGHFPHELKARFDVCTFDWSGFSLADEESRTRLAWEIREKGYDLVFGDPLDSLGINGVGSPDDTRKFLDLMKETGLHRTVAWWLNTHPRKEETKEALNEIAGAWGGKPDAVLLLRMLEGDRTQIRFPKLRWAKRGKRPTILLAFDAETEAFSYLGEEGDEKRNYVEEIDALLADGVWRTAKEIAAKKDAVKPGIGSSDTTVKAILAAEPDRYESRTGDAAQALGRNRDAHVWQVRSPQNAPNAPTAFSSGDGNGAGCVSPIGEAADATHLSTVRSTGNAPHPDEAEVERLAAIARDAA